VKCNHCVVPAGTECVNEYDPPPHKGANVLKVRVLERTEELPPNAICEYLDPSLGDYRGAGLTSGLGLVREAYGVTEEFVATISDPDLDGEYDVTQDGGSP